VSGTLIARWILEEVKLVVVLRIEPYSGLGNLSGDFRPMGIKVFLLHLFCYPPSDFFLGGGVVEDGRAVL
jgi:hypothetical protein